MAGPLEFIVAAYNDPDKADQTLMKMKVAANEGAIGIVNAAVIEKDSDGKVTIRETEDLNATKGATFGAIVGGLLGLLGGPVGVVLGAAAGAATGGAAAHKLDMGFSDEALRELQEGLKPGSSAILALVEHQWVDQLVALLEEQQGSLFRRMLAGEISDQLSQEGDPQS
jgi:uncharacterized membrane protein